MLCHLNESVNTGLPWAVQGVGCIPGGLLLYIIHWIAQLSRTHVRLEEVIPSYFEIVSDVISLYLHSLFHFSSLQIWAFLEFGPNHWGLLRDFHARKHSVEILRCCRKGFISLWNFRWGNELVHLVHWWQIPMAILYREKWKSICFWPSGIH